MRKLNLGDGSSGDDDTNVGSYNLIVVSVGPNGSLYQKLRLVHGLASGFMEPQECGSANKSSWKECVQECFFQSVCLHFSPSVRLPRIALSASETSRTSRPLACVRPFARLIGAK